MCTNAENCFFDILFQKRLLKAFKEVIGRRAKVLPISLDIGYCHVRFPKNYKELSCKSADNGWLGLKYCIIFFYKRDVVLAPSEIYNPIKIFGIGILFS